MSVGRSVCRVMHSFDDPHVAPYWPSWPSFLSFLCFSFFLCLFSAFALLPFSFAVGDMRNEVRLRLEFHFLRHLTEGRKINARVLVSSAEKREAQNWPVFFSCFWCRREYFFSLPIHRHRQVNHLIKGVVVVQKRKSRE